MGLDAWVSCNCHKEGKTSAPPVPEHLKKVDPECGVVLDLPYDGNEELYRAFDAWSQNACLHESMAYANVRVANWSGYGEFRAWLRALGWEQFSTLFAELPTSNGGMMQPERAKEVLAELEKLRDSLRPGNCGGFDVLLDSDTGEIVVEHYRGSQPLFSWSDPPGVNMGMDEHGFFLVPSTEKAIYAMFAALLPRRAEKTNAATTKNLVPNLNGNSSGNGNVGPSQMVLFRAMRFEQRLLEPELTRNHEHGRVQFVDLETGRVFECNGAVAGREISWPDGRLRDDENRVCYEYPRYMNVETRPADFSRFEGIVDALETVCRASLETGNPVVWG